MAPFGFWGLPSSTVDWCESNYEVTYYVAEFWNTISNVFIIGLAGIGAAYSWVKGYENRMILSFFSLMCIGLGSWLFHMTLLYHFQLADELPMIWGVAVMAYTLAEVRRPPGETSWILPVLLFTFCSIVTVIHLATRYALFFQMSYGSLATVVIVLGVKHSRYYGDSKILAVGGIFMYLAGFALWLVDYHLCSALRSSRSYVSHPIRPALQLHAWWHLGAGLGCYLVMMFSVHARLTYLQRNPEIQVLGGLLPIVSRGMKKKREMANCKSCSG